jgi:hypothetical protein
MEIHVAPHAFITSRIKQNKTYHTNLFAHIFKNKHTTDLSYSIKLSYVCGTLSESVL